jgi:hypothetical protein
MLRSCLVVVFLLAVPALAAGAPDPLAPLDALLGDWVADPGAGLGRGGTHFERALGGKVLLRQNHAEVPASKERPASTHDDLMVVYEERGGLHADYYDNEGHVIRYDVSVDATAHTVVLISAAVAHAPRFRFTYAIGKPDKLGFAFDIAPPDAPEAWKPYLAGELARKK